MKCHTCENHTDNIYCPRCEDEREEKFSWLDKEPDLEDYPAMEQLTREERDNE